MIVVVGSYLGAFKRIFYVHQFILGGGKFQFGDFQGAEGFPLGMVGENPCSCARWEVKKA